MWRLLGLGENEAVSYACVADTLSYSAVSDKIGNQLLQGTATSIRVSFSDRECRRSQDFLQVVHRKASLQETISYADKLRNYRPFRASTLRYVFNDENARGRRYRIDTILKVLPRVPAARSCPQRLFSPFRTRKIPLHCRGRRRGYCRSPARIQWIKSVDKRKMLVFLQSGFSLGKTGCGSAW